MEALVLKFLDDPGQEFLEFPHSLTAYQVRRRNHQRAQPAALTTALGDSASQSRPDAAPIPSASPQH
jgi:hypothetical protein